jgi:hypothetical protein
MATQMSSPSSKPSRGAVLTVFAVLFVVLAISNFSKPFHLDSRAGFVFFGVKTSGIANDILGPAFGVWLLVYAIGIWRMRRWALSVGYAYAAYVLTNLVLFTIRTGVVPGGSFVTRGDHLPRDRNRRLCGERGFAAAPASAAHLNAVFKKIACKVFERIASRRSFDAARVALVARRRDGVAPDE